MNLRLDLRRSALERETTTTFLRIVVHLVFQNPACVQRHTRFVKSLSEDLQRRITTICETAIVLPCEEAASTGVVPIMQWLRALDPPCPWNPYTCSAAAMNGHLPMLQWLRAQDPPCPWDEDTCAGAAKYGHLHIIQWARQQIPPCPWSVSTCKWSAHYGDLATLQWLRQQQPPSPWDVDTLCYAIEKSHNHILR